jgi:hypothetical protein
LTILFATYRWAMLMILIANTISGTTNTNWRNTTMNQATSTAPPIMLCSLSLYICDYLDQVWQWHKPWTTTKNKGGACTKLH